MALSKTSSPVLIRCKGILFDMDGILISSLGSVERSWTKWALMRDVDPEYAVRIAHGVRAIETVAKLRPDLDSEAELRLIEEIEIADGEGLSRCCPACSICWLRIACGSMDGCDQRHGAAGA